MTEIRCMWGECNEWMGIYYRPTCPSTYLSGNLNTLMHSWCMTGIIHKARPFAKATPVFWGSGFGGRTKWRGTVLSLLLLAYKPTLVLIKYDDVLMMYNSLRLIFSKLPRGEER